MVRITTKRAYDDIAASDGYRVLVDRLWPRGLSKEKLALKEWCRDIAPSTELRKWFNHQADKIDGFRERYLAELATNHDLAIELLKRANASGESVMTLLYSAKTAELSQAIVLKQYLDNQQE